MKINGSVGEMFLTYEQLSRIKVQEGPENAYVVTIRTWEHRGITGLNVESPRGGTPGERGDPPVSGNDVKPFCSHKGQQVEAGEVTSARRTVIVVPVEFPQTIWLNVYVGSGSVRLLKVPCGILDLDPTTGRDLLLLLGQAEYIRTGNVTIGGLFGLFVSMALLWRRNGAPENERMLSGNILEIGDFETEILSDNLEWGMNEPVGKRERGPSSVEVTVGE